MKFAVANSDPLKYLLPSNADKCWRELIRASTRDHPFSSTGDLTSSRRVLSARNTVYNSTYSFPKEVMRKRAESSKLIPPAGRASFYRERLRPELVDLSKNAAYQALLADHMRSQLHESSESSRSTLTSSSRRKSDAGVPLSNRSRRL